MARIAGVDIPREKRLEISLTYIFGIGLPTSQKICDELGLDRVFHRVRQRPGKPMWFGNIGNRIVFALPGNPVSALVCLHRYVLPGLVDLHVHHPPALAWGDRKSVV